MAPRKAKAPPAAAKTRTADPPKQRANRPAAPVATGGNSNRLLREAAWSRMFGRVESKNPFTR